jgi:gamma-glutamyl:cysteine ligase YbdK (ATP-grasp superfamily)
MNEKQIAEIEDEIKNIVIVFPSSIVRHLPALLAEVRRLRAVLAEYADHGNWICSMESTNFADWWTPSENGYTRAEGCLREDGE